MVSVAFVLRGVFPVRRLPGYLSAQVGGAYVGWREHPKQRLGFCYLIGIVAVELASCFLLLQPRELFGRRALHVRHQEL